MNYSALVLQQPQFLPAGREKSPLVAVSCHNMVIGAVAWSREAVRKRDRGAIPAKCHYS
jgi:hypothetical protein